MHHPGTFDLDKPGRNRFMRSMRAPMGQVDVVAEVGSIGSSARDKQPPSEEAIKVAQAFEAALGRTSAELEQARFEIALAGRIQERLLKEIERLERRLADVDGERIDLQDKVNHRDRLLSQIFASRSWRWTQSLRRFLGRA